MNFPEFKHAEIFSLPKQPQLNLHQAFTNLQNHCSGLLQNISNIPFLNPNLSSLKTHIESSAKHALEFGISNFNAGSSSSCKNPVWARFPHKNETQLEPAAHQSSAFNAVEVIEERLAGVPVYALSNSAEEFVLVSGVKTGKSLGLFCFKREDAESLLEQMKSMDPGMRRGSRVVAVALNKVFQLKIDGVSFRLIPESTQIKNALREMERAGVSDDAFSGVPVFQSRSLIMKSQNKRYRPVFFRKEDLENSLLRASRQQNQLNPAFRQGDIQVGVLEEMIKGMKESSTSEWNDVVFIPPGFDISTDPPQQ